MCGDPYPVELILGPLLHHQNCWRSSTRPDTIILETYLGFDKRRVQITLTSYHSKSELSCQKVNACEAVFSSLQYRHKLAVSKGNIFAAIWLHYLFIIITFRHNRRLQGIIMYKKTRNWKKTTLFIHCCGVVVLFSLNAFFHGYLSIPKRLGGFFQESYPLQTLNTSEWREKKYTINCSINRAKWFQLRVKSCYPWNYQSASHNTACLLSRTLLITCIHCTM